MRISKHDLPIRSKTLTGILLVNWARFGAVPIKVKGSTLFTGVNGVGKSTVLDALTYAFVGNRTFNKAAHDRDRDVLSYVRGDTKSNGEYQYLRSGQVTSYIMMEFYSETEKTYTTVGVCIESPDEHTVKPFWFFRKDAKISDFNVYAREGSKLIVTHRDALKCKDEKIKLGDYIPQIDRGVSQNLRALGLRIQPEGVSDYRSRLTKMVSFNPENNIDQFIRECVLPEKKITTLKDLRDKKDKFDDLKKFYDGLKAQLIALDKAEEQAVIFEGKQRLYNVKRMLKDYQDYRCALKQVEDSEAKIESNREMLAHHNSDLQIARANYAQAEQSYNTAQANLNNNDTGRMIAQLAQDIAVMEKEISECESEINRIRKLQDTVSKVMSDSEYGVGTAAVIPDFCSTEDAQTKYSILTAIRMKRNNSLEKLTDKRAELRREISNDEKKIEQLSEDIKRLERKVSKFSGDVARARDILQHGLRAKGIDAEVRIFADLVDTVLDEEWRDAIEVFLGRNRFNLIVDAEHIEAARDVFHEKKIHGTSLVFTDMLPVSEVTEGSAASVLKISNIYARRYANYLLNDMHLCDTLAELHNHPRGGIMRDGTVARGITMRNQKMDRVDYYLGAEAFELMCETLKGRRAELYDIINVTKREAAHISELLKVLSDGIFEEDFRFEAIPQLAQLSAKKLKAKASKENLETDPSLIAVMEECKRAEDVKDRAEALVTSINKSIAVCENTIENLEKGMPFNRETLEKAEKEYTALSAEFPELRSEAETEYEKLCEKRPDGIVIKEKTISEYNTEMNKAVAELCKVQRAYLQIAGKNIERAGAAFIPEFRADRAKIANISIEETRIKLDDTRAKLEDAFMHDFVNEIMESVEDAQKEIAGINNELERLPFGQDLYSFKAYEHPERSAFFRIKKKIDEKYMGNVDYYLDSESSDLDDDIEDFMNTILEDYEDEEYSDYRNYLKYDIRIKNKQVMEAEIDLSRKQGSASNGEKQTPYYLILAASLMQYYPREGNCARMVFIDEAFAALSSERIEQLVNYFESNGFQVMYAAPPEKISSIGAHIDSTVSLIETGRYTNAVEGLADDIIRAAEESERDPEEFAGTFA